MICISLILETRKVYNVLIITNIMDAGLYLQEHSEELSRKYTGKYLAVIDGQIVAVASNALVAYKKAKEVIRDKEIAIFYISTDEETIILI